MQKFNYTYTYIQSINDPKELIKRWSQGKIPTQYMTKDQITLLKKFIRHEINWNNINETISTFLYAYPFGDNGLKG